MANSQVSILRCGAVIGLALVSLRVLGNDSDHLLAIEPATQNEMSEEEFHEAVRRSLRGYSYTLVTAPSGVHLLLIEDDPEDAPVAHSPGEIGVAELLAGAPDANERARAINVLGDFPDAISHAIVTSALADPDARVREEAVDSLAHIDSVASMASLQLALRDPEQRVRAAAILVIAENDAMHLLRNNWEAMSSADRLTAVDAAGDNQGNRGYVLPEFRRRAGRRGHCPDRGRLPGGAMISGGASAGCDSKLPEHADCR